MFATEENQAGICQGESLKGTAKNSISFPEGVSSCADAERRIPKQCKPEVHAQGMLGGGSFPWERFRNSHTLASLGTAPNLRAEFKQAQAPASPHSPAAQRAPFPFPCHGFTREGKDLAAERTVRNKGFENRLLIKNDTTARLVLSTH